MRERRRASAKLLNERVAVLSADPALMILLGK
jgi:hypothetical protein